MTITFAAWWIPTLITVVAVLVTIFWPTKPSGGFVPDLTPIFVAIQALFVSLVAWIVYAIWK